MKIRKFNEDIDFDNEFDWEEEPSTPELDVLQNLYDFICLKHKGPKTKLNHFLKLSEYMVQNGEITQDDLDIFLEKIGEERPKRTDDLYKMLKNSKRKLVPIRTLTDKGNPCGSSDTGNRDSC